MSDNYYGHDFGRPEVGTQTLDMMLYDEIAAADGGKLPAAIADRGTYRAKPGPVPFSRYTDPALVALEVEHIWDKCWTVACREEDIPKVGDRTRYDLVDRSYMLVRTGTDTIKAFYNSCRHRGRALCDGRSNDDKIQCLFHGWTWTLEGELSWVPGRQDFPQVETDQYGLIEVRVETWGGNVFINPDPDAQPLASSLGVLTDHFLESPQEERFTAVLMHKKIRANWKLAQEAFMEAYHMVETHWDALPFSGDANTLYDCWSAQDNEYCSSRVLTPLAVPSPFLESEVSVEEAAQAFLKNLGYDGEMPAGDDLGKLRNFAADVRRKDLAAMVGRSFEGEANTTMIDAVKYFQFPNFHPWWGEGVPLWYRFLPVGHDPNECLMEVRLLAPMPASGERPPVPEPIVVDYEQHCSDIPALAFLGHIFDQDMGNIPHVQTGIKAAPVGLGACTLAREQESSITHFHEVYADRLDLKKGQ
jgi:phenylpropionate dioxygenase-like ring-hydroxylating dioxygenase large terminal subunit